MNENGTRNSRTHSDSIRTRFGYRARLQMAYVYCQLFFIWLRNWIFTAVLSRAGKICLALIVAMVIIPLCFMFVFVLSFIAVAFVVIATSIYIKEVIKNG